MISDRGIALDFDMAMSDDSRIYDTFDAYRLLHGAMGISHQAALRIKLFDANFTWASPHPTTKCSSPQRPRQARSGRGSGHPIFWSLCGGGAGRRTFLAIAPHFGPAAVVINEKYLISGDQPTEVFEKALGRIATEAARA